MSIKLPPIVGAFLKAKNSRDSKAFVACFSEEAVVQDEGQKYSGKAAIKKWIEESSVKYKVTVAAKSFLERDNESILTAQISGNFQGSPVMLDYHFIIDAGKISRLSIYLTDE
jgi:hypothetical protein